MTSAKRKSLFVTLAVLGVVASTTLTMRGVAQAAARAAGSAESETLAAAPGWVDVEGGTQHLGARTEGIVQEVAVKAGDRVAANALLLRFDDHQSHIDNQLAELEVERNRQQQKTLAAQLKRVAERISRLQPLVEAQAEPRDELVELLRTQTDLVSQSELAKLAGQSLVLQAQSAHERQSRMELHAPRAGRILRVSAHAGEMVSSGSELLWFASDGPLIVRAELDERLFGAVEPGMTADISPEYDDDKRYSAQVIRLAPMVGPVRDLPDVRAATKDDRVVECDLQLDEQAVLLIGQRVLVRIHTHNAAP